MSRIILASSGPKVRELPTEVWSKIARSLVPELPSIWIPETNGEHFKTWQQQRDPLLALQLVSRQLNAICRPLLWSGLCFPKEPQQAYIIDLLLLNKGISLWVKQVRWEVSSVEQLGRAPLLLRSLPKVKSLAVFTPAVSRAQSQPLPISFTPALTLLENLKTLQIEGFDGLGESQVDLSRSLRRVQDLTIGSWWRHFGHQNIPRPLRQVRFIVDEDLEADEAAQVGGVVDCLAAVKHVSVASRSRRGKDGEIGSVLESLEGLKPKILKAFKVESIELAGYRITNTETLIPSLKLLSTCKYLRTLAFIDCPPGSVVPSDKPMLWDTLSMPFVTSLTIHLTDLPLLPYYHRDGYPQIEDGSDILKPILPCFPNLTHLDISNFPAPPLTPHSNNDTLHDLTAHTYIFLLLVKKETSVEKLVIRFPSSNEVLRFEREAEAEISDPLYDFRCSLWHEC